jgi:hypothetical protein
MIPGRGKTSFFEKSGAEYPKVGAMSERTGNMFSPDDDSQALTQRLGQGSGQGQYVLLTEP